jgi:acetyltransferase EpsM
MSKSYCIYGASGHAKVIVEIIEQNGYLIKKIYDDDPDKKSLLNFPVFNDKGILSLSGVEWIIAIGNNITRKEIATSNSLIYGTAIDVKSNISNTSQISPGTVIMPGASINSSTKIGVHCVINTNASIDHDCIVGDYVHVSPNAALCGAVTIGEGSHVGAGAVIIPGIHIGKWATIGAGAVILKDVPDYSTVVGNPGKVIKTNYF